MESKDVDVEPIAEQVSTLNIAMSQRLEDFVNKCAEQKEVTAKRARKKRNP